MRAASLVFVFFALTGAARAGDDLPVPRGSRSDGSALVSSLGFAETIAYVGKELDRRGLAFTKVGPYRAHGVDVARFVAPDSRAPWTAIHVFRARGKTWISFVKRSP
jgi:hypothetical protein